MPTYDHFVIELRKGEPPTVIRTHTVKSVDDAINMIEALRDVAHGRDYVTWRDEEVDAKGDLFGLAPGGEIWQIHVTPPLTVELS